MKENENISKMRTIEAAYAELIAFDPKCCLTKTALRRLVVEGEIKSVRIGAKYLIDMAQLNQFLTGESPAVKPAEPKAAGIRRADA